MQQPREQLRKLVLTGLFAGVASAIGYLFILIPNVEGFTAMVFTSGYVLGLVYGIMSAIIASLIFFGLNPQGGVLPPVLVAQMIGMLTVAMAGNLYFKFCRTMPDRSKVLLLAGIGAILTLWYDVLTTLAYPLTAGAGIKTFFVWFIAGIPFTIVHVAANTFIFIFLVPLILDFTDKFRHTYGFD